MLNKTILSERVYKIADQYNIKQVTVHTIIDEYINYCKERVSNGSRVDFIGLCSVIPYFNTQEETYNSTLARDCKLLSDKIKLPAYTVYAIINEYLLNIREEVLSGKSSSIRGIVTLQPLKTDGVVTMVHSHASLTFKEALGKDKPIRVSTSKSLKVHVRRSSL